MKALIILATLLISITSCQKKDYICTCTSSGIFGGSSTTVYKIHGTKRKAERQCDSYEGRKGFEINFWGPNCTLR